ncbi:MAG: PDZ domain-containing protein [Planctomycetota bacterium]|nr:PDZ domain-containing protein [Planctomycetota bacterium]
MTASAAVLTFLPAQDNPPIFDSSTVEHLAWRHLGPANPMGRMTDIAVHDDRQSTWFVGTAGGGVWRTKNAGTTWECVFNDGGTVSIGDVAIAPSDPDVVYVGTGEENARNSVQWGDGVYKSTDGGDTWTHLGLRETFQIGHVEVHPTNPDIVYVAALGRLWGANEERGVYRSQDGGATWERVLHVDDQTGGIDVRVHPRDPMTVFACLYERKRDRFDGNDPVVRFGQHSGLYKSVDGGANWRKLTAGLPTCTWGRSGIDLMSTSPDTMFAIIETERSGWATGDTKDAAARRNNNRGGRARRNPRGSAILGVGTEGADGDPGGAVLTTVTEGGPAEKAGLQVGDRVTVIDDEAVATYADLVEIIRDSRGGQQIKLAYARGDVTTEVEITFDTRQASGMASAMKPNGPFSGRLFGQEANRQTRQGERGYETGGVFRSDDRGETWTRLNSLTERPFYYSVIRVDPRNADNLYSVGTTLWGSTDGGEKFSAINRGIHVDFHGIWVDPDDSEHLVAVCDGGVNETWDQGRTWQVHKGFSAAQYYDCEVDNSVPYNVIGGLQDNGTWVVPSQTRYRDGVTTLDCFKIYSGDGFGAQADPLEPHVVFATSQNGNLGVVDTRTGRQARMQRVRPSGSRVRFNWDAPFILSPHNRLVVYHAGSHLFRGDRHSHLDSRGARPGQGPIVNDGSIRMTAVSPRLGDTEDGTACALAESPLRRGLLYVGTDDGALWRTDDGGAAWVRIDQNLPVDARLYVSDIVPSNHRADRVYVTLDGHRSDDFGTHVFVSDDLGETFYSMADTLPGLAVCHSFAEDPRNPELLFLGTEHGAWASLDRGYNWLRLSNGMPNVSVRELVIQDRDSDLVAATHGRGIFVLDIEGLRQTTRSVTLRDAWIAEVEPAYLWKMKSRGFQGSKQFKAANPGYGAQIYLWLREPPDDPPRLIIEDITGKKIGEARGAKVRGLQAIRWDARAGRSLVAPGSYRVRLADADGVQPRVVTLRSDPATSPASPAATKPQTSR